jgi:hypothetical protein
MHSTTVSSLLTVPAPAAGCRCMAASCKQEQVLLLQLLTQALWLLL